MIHRIIEFSVRNRALVFAIVAAACVAGWWSLKRVPLDAIPDLSDTQVIIYSRWDRSPDILEAQVTYPIVSAMLGAPKVKSVRGFSDFGYSYVYVIFEDGTDLYWARSRTQEYLAAVQARLPAGVVTEMGPDATALGWVFQYALVDDTGKHSLADLRSYQDWHLKYYLKSVPGVAEIAPVGGFGKQFQVNVDPIRLQAYGLSISRVVEAVRSANKESAGRLLEFGSTEYMVRGRGYLKSVADIENIALATKNGTPIRVRDIGQVAIGPDLRRGLCDLDGQGEVVSGIVVMRHGQNALDVINRVKARLHEIEPGLPAGMKIVPIYDRSELIHRSIDNLKSTLLEIIVVVMLVIFLFLWHVPSAIIPAITIPIAVLVAFIPFRMMGITANIMSLGGIAIAIGALVDAAIVVVEQVHKSLEQWERGGRRGSYQSVVLQAIQQVARPSFFALLIIAVSFLPVLTLEAQEGRLFTPLAYTKTLAMVVAAVLVITLDPALRVTFTHVKRFRFRPEWLCRLVNATALGTIHSESRHPISRFLIRLYEPVLGWALRWKWAVIGGAALLVVTTVPVFFKLGSEFMPPLDEGSILYMPSTMPGISITEAQRVLQVTDRILKQFPEVDRVLGKAGRAETPTDPAPLSMLETVIILKPKEQWRRADTWYSAWAPGWLKSVLRHVTSDRISSEELINQMNLALQVPGLANGWTMPIKGRIEMLSTGLRTPVGLKIAGSDLATIEKIGSEIEAALRRVPGTRSAFAERTGSGFFLDIEWDREALARYGISIEEAQATIENSLGGDNVTTIIAGQERYPVNVRYARDFRSDLSALQRVLVSSADGETQVPLGQVARVEAKTGPAMIRNEDGLLTGYVYVDVAGRDLESYLADAGRQLREQIKLPPGYAYFWSGQYESLNRMKERLFLIVPVTLFLIFLLLYLNTRSMAKTMIVLLAVPFSAVGAVWFLYLLGYHMSIGVWVGLIALLGVDAETGIFMLTYLDLAYEQAKKEGRLRTLADLQRAISYGAVQRLRPKFMTVATTFIGLVPIMWSLGTGSDVMKRIAAPMIGGIFTSFLLELLVYPGIYQIWKWHAEAGTWDLHTRARPLPESRLVATEDV
ncbi:MAG: efflux RND transporter permease subunit [Verrucomicrobia bacterium]|nr:efflux RND transporter permease subunit [Verrucomicrobiota bacterium]